MSNASSIRTSDLISTASSQEQPDPSQTPDFIYGGPFIKQNLSKGFFMEANTPLNSRLEGTYKLSPAYHGLQARMPIILTKVIDRISKSGVAGSSAVISQIAELKNAIATNKTYEPLQATTEDAKKWNEDIDATPCKQYFNNSWLFTECYIYRKLRDIFENSLALQEEDPFTEVKERCFNDMLEASCIAAEELAKMLEGQGAAANTKQQNQQYFALLAKMCLWSNKCDSSLSAGSSVTINSSNIGEGARAMDPVRWVEEFKANVVIDDSLKVPLEFKVGKPINPTDAVEIPSDVFPPTPPSEGAPPPTPPPAPEKPEPEKVPCPARIVDIQTFFVDIVCDNAGFELVCDLLLGDFLIQKQIAHKVRYHVKSIPWFVSDVTPADFRKTIEQCLSASYFRTAPGELPPPPPPPKVGKGKKPPPPPPAPAEPPPPPPPRDISSDALVAAATRWQEYYDNGQFLLLTDDFWTTAHPYIKMKSKNYNLFRRFQYSQLIIFKGDLNYRKLLDDTKVNPTLTFEKALKGFHPAPIVAIRTVKCDLIAGMPRGKADQLTLKDPTWMESSDYGLIQFCKKKDPLKAAEKPCYDYGTTCFGVTCPARTDVY